MSAQVGVILAQVGTPANLERGEIRRYLKEFLSDQRVIDLPRWKWWPILHGIVLPRRPQAVGKHYEEIWTDAGSPLLVTSTAQRDGLAGRLGDDYRVELGLAYSEPALGKAIGRLEEAGIRKIVVLPMFPQFSTSTTASIYDAVMFAALGRRPGWSQPRKKYAPTVHFVHPFYDDPAYIGLLAANVSRQLADGPEPDHVVISYHGVPQRFIDQGDPYVEQCRTTTRLLVEALGWPEDYYELAFQSRFGRTEWVKPYLQPRLGELHAAGYRRPAILAPGFTTDCLETLHELAIEGRELFEEGGGDPVGFRALSCLNDDPAWLDYAADLIRRNSQGLLAAPAPAASATRG